MYYEAFAKSSLETRLNSENNASRASTWLNVKFPLPMLSSVTLGIGEIRAIVGMIPNLSLRSASPRLEAGMCANG